MEFRVEEEKKFTESSVLKTIYFGTIVSNGTEREGLLVTFKNSDSYFYGFNKSTFNALAAAESPGSFYNTYIKGAMGFPFDGELMYKSPEVRTQFEVELVPLFASRTETVEADSFEEAIKRVMDEWPEYKLRGIKQLGSGS